MECPNCKAENEGSSQYCGNCATPLSGRQTDPDSPTQYQATLRVVTPPQVGFEGSFIAGKYRVFEKIGRGGMGVVYRAEDTQLKRAVALKFLPPELADSGEHKERFLIEARAAAALSHPNICTIHEVGETEKGPYIAMEYVDGETLRTRIKKRPPKTEEALAITRQMAAGLGAAHQKGIIHRDIKSANIMVTGTGQTKIMDFGLAKLEGGSPLTGSHSILGTIAYMSPEQARGERVDARTDLWSLGVVLYEMLAGVLPFRGDRELSVIHSIIHDDPAPIARHKQPIPLALQQVVARALTKKRAARYGSAEEILKDLTAYEAALQAEASGVLTLNSLLQRLRRPLVVVPTALVAAMIVVIFVWWIHHQSKVRWARNVAIPEIERMVEANDAWRDLVPAYRLAEQAEAIISRDSKLAELFSKCSLKIDIRTEPPGASVSMKEYKDAGAEWSFLGVTPLEQVRVPIGIFRWKIEKQGYDTVLAAESTWNIGAGEDFIVAHNLVRTLDEEGSAPPGMVRVQATETDIGALSDFFIGRNEVTNQEYRVFVDASGYRDNKYWKQPVMKEGRKLSWEEAVREFVDQSGLPGPATWVGGDFPQGRGEHPVSGVSWYEAAAYAEYAGMALPTNTHWNVARGGFTPMIQWPQLGGFAVLAPFSNFSNPGTVPVSSLGGYTAYGAHDMAGNLREWCWNETAGGRVIRGGAHGDNSYEFECGRGIRALDRSTRNGFRLAFYPDRGSLPEAAFGPQQLYPAVDARTQEPVTDAVFQAYREQFFYDSTPLNARVEDRAESPAGWIWEKVSFDAAYGGERVPAHLFLPTNTPPPYQTVIYFPGDAAKFTASSEDLESYYEFTMFLSFLLRDGRAVLFPVYQGTFERSSPAVAYLDASYANVEFVIQVVKDFRRCIDYLETREDIDSEKLAYYGMSWGACMGNVIPAVEDRLNTSVLVAGGITGLARPKIRDLSYVTRVRIPTLMLNGRYDSILPLETSTQPMFNLLGTAAEDKRLILYDTDHIPPRAEYIKETLAWLDTYLGPVRR